jgi:2-aminoadipate transaminase
MSTAKPKLSKRSGWAADQPIGFLMQKALEHPELISLAAGFVDQSSLPVEATRTAATALLSDAAGARAGLQYGTTSGDAVLRRQILERLRAADPGAALVRVDEEQLVLTAGSNQMLYLLAEALLDPGDIVLCDAPSYFVFMGVVKNMGAVAVGVATDEHGMRMDALEAELARLAASGELSRVKAIYVVSYFDNPRSVSLAAERRGRVVELAQRYSRDHVLYVIEDAAYRELRYAGEDVPSIRSHDAAGEHVIYAGTFSKSFSPGLRVGYGVLPKTLLGAVIDIKGNFDFGSPHLNQRVLSEVMRLGLYDSHVVALREVYRKKLAAMLEALDEHLGRPGLARYLRPHGGLYVWVELAQGIDTGQHGALFARCVEEGVLYVPGAYFFSDVATAPASWMRLSFGVQNEERIAEGVRKLARAIERVSG